MQYVSAPPISPEDSTTILQPDETTEGHWVGSPAVHTHGSDTYLAVRKRTPRDRGHALTVYERTGRTSYEPVTEIKAEELGVQSIERPALVTDPDTGALKMYISVDHDSNCWTIQKLGDVSTPEAFDPATAHDVLTPQTGTSDEVTVKDPYILTLGNRYYMFYAGSDGRSEQAHLATSPDGETWTRPSTNPVLGRQYWHDYHTRISCVVPAPDAPTWVVFYEGCGSEDYRKTWNLRTGTAVSHDLTTVTDTSATGPEYAAPTADRRTGVDRFATFRYVDILDQGATWTVFFEVARDDGAFELRQTTVSVDG